MIHYSMGNEPVGVVYSSLQDIRAPLFSWEWPCQFYTILHTSSVLASVPSWIAVFFLEGAFCCCWFICASVSRKFSLKSLSSNSSFAIYSNMISSSPWSLRDPSLSQRLSKDTSCCWSVHFFRRGTIKKHSLTNSNCWKVLFFLSLVRLLVHITYYVCYSVLYMQNTLYFMSASAKDCAKNNKIYMIMYILQYFC